MYVHALTGTPSDVRPTLCNNLTMQVWEVSASWASSSNQTITGISAGATGVLVSDCGVWCRYSKTVVVYTGNRTSNEHRAMCIVIITDALRMRRAVIGTDPFQAPSTLSSPAPHLAGLREHQAGLQHPC